MDRRTLLKGLAGVGSLAATGGLSMPALSQGAAARTLRFVPQANLANFDPIWGTQYVVRNAAALVWDTLYGLDATLQPQRRRRIDRRSRDHIGERHAHAQKLGHGRHLIKGRPVDAQGMDIRRDGVR